MNLRNKINGHLTAATPKGKIENRFRRYGTQRNRLTPDVANEITPVRLVEEEASQPLKLMGSKLLSWGLVLASVLLDPLSGREVLLGSENSARVYESDYGFRVRGGNKGERRVEHRKGGSSGGVLAEEDGRRGGGKDKGIKR